MTFPRSLEEKPSRVGYTIFNATMILHYPSGTSNEPTAS
jgi:hypothetical protein